MICGRRAVKDEKEVQLGDSCDEKAKSAFEKGDFKEAYLLYAEAESHYREGFSWPGEKVFFAQHDALRCLEQLIEQGQLEFYEDYKKRAKAFFKEWTEDVIKTRFSHGWRGKYAHRMEEALAFRLWRKSFFEGSFVFRNVEAAVLVGDFEKARGILDEFIQRLKESIDPESDALLAIARSKREILTAREELRKPKNLRNIVAIIASYKYAADVCQLPEHTRSRQRERIAVYGDWFRSHQYKFMAFSCLRDEKMKPDPEHALFEAEQNVMRAIDYAKRAILNPYGVNFPKSHLQYLTFWQVVVSERLHLLRFMKEGDEREYELCMQDWQLALDIAEDFVNQYGEESIFPNRFYSLEDLRLEEEFLKAAHALKQQKLLNCINSLEIWRRKFPSEYYWSWKDLQIYIRLHVVRALQSFFDRNQQNLTKICEELKKVKKEPIGRVGRFLCSRPQELRLKLKNNIPLTKEEYQSICTKFPIDSYIDNFEPDKELDPFLSLHPRIYNWINQAQTIEESEVKGCKAKLLGAIEALLGYICDYQLQNLSLSESVPTDLKTLIEKLSQLAQVIKDEKFTEIFKKMKIEIDNMEKAEDAKSYAPIYERTRGRLSELMQFVPVIVNIEPSISFTKRKRIKASPEWRVDKYRPERKIIWIQTSPETSIEAGKYYLPPRYRKGIPTCYSVDEKRPIFPVHFEPRWWLWETEIGVTYLKLQKEKAVFVLGKYGENEPIEKQKFYLEELTKLRDYLRNKGYSAYLVKEMPEFSKLIEQKEKLCMLASKFCIWIYRDPSWAISEYEYGKELKTVLAILPAKGLLKRLREEIKRVPILHMEVFEFDESPLESIDAAVEWAERFLRERRA
jgi:hypothetical protein